jgi:hypothetical protein
MGNLFLESTYTVCRLQKPVFMHIGWLRFLQKFTALASCIHGIHGHVWLAGLLLQTFVR